MTVQEVDTSARPSAPATATGSDRHPFAATLEGIGERTSAYLAAVERIDSAERADLYGENGRPRYVLDELPKVKAKYDQKRTAALERWRQLLQVDESDANDAIAAAQRDLLRLSADPVETLPPADLARLDQLRGYVADKVERLAIPDLVQQIQSATARGDKATMALYASYGAARLQAARESGEYGPKSPVLAQLSSALEALDQVLIDPETRTKRARVRQRLDGAEQVRQAIEAARGQADPDYIAERNRRWGIRG